VPIGSGNAMLEWVSTGIALSEGDDVFIIPDGEVTYTLNDDWVYWCGANGAETWPWWCNIRSGSAGPYGGISGPSSNTSNDLRLFYRINRPGTWAKILAYPASDRGPGILEVSRAGADNDVWSFGGHQRVFIWVKRAPRPPPPPELKLKCEPSRLPRGNSTTCTATAQPADGFVVQTFSFAGDSGAVASHAGDNKSWTFIPPQGGTVTVTATVAGTNLTARARVEVFTPCSTGLATLDDPEVQSGLCDLWRRSNPEAPMADRREQGGWLVRVGDDFMLDPFPPEWISQPCALTPPEDFQSPPGTIAMVHTHPYARREPLTSCDKQELPGGLSMYINYSGDPSIDDDSTMLDLRSRYPNLIGLVIDQDQIIAYTGSPVDEPSRYPRCGY
jgi:hypothetical protein